MIMQALVSVGGILLIVGLAWWLGPRRPAAPLDDALARDLAQMALGGFDAAEVVLDGQGRGAFVAGRDGRFALIKAHGAQWAVRGLGPSAAGRVENAGLVVDPGDPMFGTVRLDLDAEAAAALAARLGGGAADGRS